MFSLNSRLSFESFISSTFRITKRSEEEGEEPVVAADGLSTNSDIASARFINIAERQRGLKREWREERMNGRQTEAGRRRLSLSQAAFVIILKQLIEEFSSLRSIYLTVNHQLSHARTLSASKIATTS